METQYLNSYFSNIEHPKESNMKRFYCFGLTKQYYDCPFTAGFIAERTKFHEITYTLSRMGTDLQSI